MVNYSGPNLVDQLIQQEYNRTRPRMPADIKAERAFRQGFNGGLSGWPSDSGIGAATMPHFLEGEKAGRAAYDAYDGVLPPRTVSGRFGYPRPNPAFKKVADALYAQLKR